MSANCPICAKPLAAGAPFCEECAKQLFTQALAMEPASREEWLWRACQYNEPLFQAVRAMADQTGPTASYIGPYKMLRELGRGGMGIVYLAVRDDGAFKKNVAIKLLLRENVTPEFVTRFKQERQVLAALDHPNIARILDGGDAPDGMPYYVMEYVEGQPIDQYCDTQRLSLTNRIKTFQQLCQAVQYLHQNSILHRDLKPANVLVSSEGAVKLLDFGIAKLVGAGSFANSDVTSVQGQLMTPGYASPEQMTGAPLQPGSDVYSLGTILYFLLTGRPPFSGYEEKMAKTAARQGPAPPSAAIRPELQATESTAHLRRAMLGQLDSIVLKALRVDPRDRYTSANDLAGDLQRFLDGEPVAAHHEGVAGRSWRVLRRAWVAVAFLLLAGVAAWQWQRTRTETSAVSQREASLRDLLDQMEKRLSGTSVDERIADVGRVGKTFAQEYPAIAARGASDAELLPRAVRYVDRVQVAGVPALGVAVADTYQQLGILQESVAAPKPALATYQKAAATLSNYRADAAVQQRLAMLRERVQNLGGTLPEPEPPAPEPAAPTQTAAPEPAPAKPPVVTERPKTVAAPTGPTSQAPQAPAPVRKPDPVAAPPPAGVSAELQEDLISTESRVQIAEAAIAPIAASLTERGQTLNSDTLANMARMKAMLEKGRAEMASGNGAGAKESFAISRALAAKVLRTVGR
ncbi:MAG: serine/threonine protein kinase [Bryobacteraceae bacterium]|nr:serine/threonine protein kinase [Bryobacteraceae bacterium]